MNAPQTNATMILALKTYRELERLHNVDADIATIKFQHKAWTDLAGQYAEQTGQSLSDAKAILSALS